jgi:hypothetical protein
MDVEDPAMMESLIDAGVDGLIATIPTGCAPCSSAAASNQRPAPSAARARLHRGGSRKRTRDQLADRRTHARTNVEFRPLASRAVR